MKLRLSLFPIAAAMASSAMAAPPTSGTISVEAQGKDVAPALTSAFAETVGKALTDQGMTVLEGTGHGRFVVDVRLSRSEAGAATADVRRGKSVATGRGIPTGIGGSLNIALPTTKSKLVPLQQTRVEIEIRQRDQPAVLWRAEAVTVRAADAKDGSDQAVAGDLAAAIFRGYPAQPEAVIGVP